MFNSFLLISYYLGFMLLVFSFLSCCAGVHFYLIGKVLMLEWEIFDLFSSSFLMVILFDWMSLMFTGFVSFISGVVLLYSSFYMTSSSYGFKRFIMLVYLFVISMMFLILSPNMMSILIGWDGLGLVSYCLVIYYQNVKSANAGMLTILSNRIGDVAILLSIAWLANFGSWNFFFLQYMYKSSVLFFILFFMILAGMTKSAQIPFSAWLPAAMAAPTPVSALVHSSTLVTAGVYLLVRFNILLGENSILFYIGTMTMFMSGLGANYETDLKKVIALSTLSQLGVMMMALSLGSMEIAFFHLLSHALFKSLLFLCAGVFIHSMLDTQDFRYMGGIGSGFTLSSFFFVGCSLSLCGFVFLSGFYSKDLLLEYYFMGEMNFFMFFFVFLGTLFTVSYSFRLGYYLFVKNLGVHSWVSTVEDTGMVVPMGVLFLVSVTGGGVLSWIFFPGNTVVLSGGWKLCVLMGIILVSFLSLMNFLTNFLDKINFFKNQLFMGLMWFLPFLSTILWMPALKLGGVLVNYLDRGWVEYMGGQGVNFILSLKNVKMDYFLSLSLKSFIFLFFVLGLLVILY